MKMARAPLDGSRKIGGEAQPALGDVLGNELLEAWFVDGDDALMESVDLLLIDVDADNVIAKVGQPCAGDETDVASPDDCNSQSGSLRLEKCARMLARPTHTPSKAVRWLDGRVVDGLTA